MLLGDPLPVVDGAGRLAALSHAHGLVGGAVGRYQRRPESGSLTHRRSAGPLLRVRKGLRELLFILQERSEARSERGRDAIVAG